MRLSDPACVRAYAEKAAFEDYMRGAVVHAEPSPHGWSFWQCDVNPYCTPGRRSDWQRGFNGDGPRSYEHVLGVECDVGYQRGAAYRRIIERNQAAPD